MARWGKVDYRQLKRLQQKIDKLAKKDLDQFCEECAKELAARLLRKVIKRTPVGQYPGGSGKTGGTLRRGWTAGSEREAMAEGAFRGSQAKADSYVDSLNITKSGTTYTIEIVNPVNYASYVESGHRTRGHGGWVPGQFFLKISENEIQQMAPSLLEKKLEKFLRGVFDG